ncbi:hypothetical protein ACGFR8_07845 [Streptomyces brevispora]|uniref:hypothetical protein n=1 Tax=Streptomyces brevispora TaxID=887462 RepID=UPI003721EF5E
MFRETITHAGGTTEGTASETHAVTLLVRAARRQYAMEATPAGGALITWTRHVFGPGGNSLVLVDRSIRLDPMTPVGNLTDTVREDLSLVDGDPRARYDLVKGRRVITGTLWQVPPFPTAGLRARRLVVEDRGRVRLTLTARLGLLAHAHRTTTTAPRGWYHPSAYESAGLNRPGRRAGLLRDSTSAAVCSCLELSAVGGDREHARRLALDHRRAVTAEFVADRLAVPVNA